MVRDWFRSQLALLAELEETRAWNATLQTELADTSDENGELHTQLQHACRERDAGRRTIGDLLVKLDSGDRAMSNTPIPHTPTQELLMERARADALAQRLHEIEQQSLGVPAQ